MIGNDIALATIDNGCYADYLGKSGLDVIIKPPSASPAAIYNQILDETKQRYVCFIHSDVTCNGLLQAIRKTIEASPGYVLGVVGVDKEGYIWSNAYGLRDIITCDSCCVVIDKEMGLRFDDKLFDGLHLYVEDICMQAGKVTTMFIDAFDGLHVPPNIHLSGMFNNFIHHSYTYRKLGPMWGDYRKYKALLEAKWPGVKTT